MSGEGIEALGEAVTGGMAARAAEPDAGEHREGAGTCLNCGCELVGAYCHCCGQAGHVHRTLAAWWHDLAHGVLHFDGKIWRTLPLLAWHPGRLTRRYIEGERAKFVSPLALFLFSVFTMFAVISLTGGQVIGSGNPERAQQEIGEARRLVATLEAQRAQASKAGGDVAAIDNKLEDARDELKVAEGLSVLDGGEMSGLDIETGWQRLDKGLDKAAENPSLLFYKLQTNAYKFSWALIPMSLPLLWILFLHRRRYRIYKAYDHIVFITYSIAFMSLLLIAIILLSAIGLSGGWIALPLLLGPPIHIYRQLRGAYALSRASALWRTVALLLASQLAIGTFVLLLLGLGVLG